MHGVNGRVPVGVNSDDTDFASVEKTGGEKKVTLTLAQIPSHSHTFTGSKHTHSFSATSGNQSANHTHSLNSHTHSISLNTNETGGHIHDIYDNSYGSHARFAGFNAPEGSTNMWRPAKNGLTDSSTAILKLTTAGAHKHTVSGSTGGNSGSTGNNSGSHTHSISGTTGEATQGGTVGNAGGGEAHSNLQPYITCYMWKRVA